jgi:transportin-3
MLGGQEHELTMRTAELIEDNAQQALELLIRYATSSRMFSYSLRGFVC